MKQINILIDGELYPVGTSSVFNKNTDGLVPAPNTDEELYLKSDGTWGAISGDATEIDSISIESINTMFLRKEENNG